MNKTAISPEALNRFREAASQYNHVAKSRASRLLALKEDIAALRKRGISYRSISELLAQNGISASDTCVTNFCHRVLKEPPIRKSATKRRATLNGKRGASTTHSPAAPAKTTPAPVAKPVAVPVETRPFAARGPRIAKVEQLPPGETI
jgi:hypothetical protein